MSRSPAVAPEIAAESVLPGHDVMPIRPWPSPGVIAAMRIGLLSLVLAVAGGTREDSVQPPERHILRLRDRICTINTEKALKLSILR